MKNRKINKLPNKEENQESFEEKRMQAFRQFMATHFKEISFKDRLYLMQASRTVN